MRLAKGIGLCVALVYLLAAPAFPQEQSFRIVGRIRLEDNSPVPGNLVIRLDRLGVTMQEKMSTDGGFVFDDLPTGLYTIAIAIAGHVTIYRAVDVVGNEWVDIDLRSSPPARSGKSVAVLDYQIPRTAQRHLERAEKMIRENNCGDALRQLQQANQRFPRYVQALNAAGDCLVRMNRPEAAERAFKDAIALTSSVYPALNLADLYIRQGRMSEADEVLTNGLQRSPYEGDAYFGLARLRFEQNRQAEAEDLCRQAHQHGTHSADVHLLMAKVHYAVKNLEQIPGDLQMYINEAQPGPARDFIIRLLGKAYLGQISY